jgi:excisionase family DNA binding protein
MPHNVLTIPEVASLFRMSEKKTYRVAESGGLPAFELGGAWRFRRLDIAVLGLLTKGARPPRFDPVDEAAEVGT